MVSINPADWWRSLLARPNDDKIKTIVIAGSVAIASALLVSTSNVLLRPIQEQNRERERQAKIVSVVSAAIGETGPLIARIVNLRTGQYKSNIDAVSFDQRAAARDPQRSVKIPEQVDIAKLERRAKHARVFVREISGKTDLIVLPIHGRGYQSIIYAYLALRGDMNTIAALTVYEQGETPGLGNRITEPAWQNRWAGKKINGSGGLVKIKIVQGNAAGPHEVDGISGASRTGAGVTNAVQFWLGDHGFGPLLTRLRKVTP